MKPSERVSRRDKVLPDLSEGVNMFKKDKLVLLLCTETGTCAIGLSL
jgi:hypothetical protein